ncbi:uncharacterized protein LOC126983673 [Eriocheir sinensis]|uniref:uncharacterized protein LOC126983673 n=1 Tax=Eriocheir sinensis TaxID=95602 RepID=UPI0021C9A775|nr:uncharacterized protein LOC126983673 [Eriocheir sinensis]XP_050692605.1 uncharacterized protein LOC126983673 [Eriocheir sinensis]XP_050692606.1 uncharacterized protein LOC126983673 [Eriocheir sinensis]XP_050692607.1 uncharacterized protein LOC126983673 [Eriocheir sinensis]XP_050692608.1 uncharacterized protein LOC126983673 [Eriocheir sinensis]XP_050692609.1 uncharacterized protein LOC126983673 [Eriocheir sinensis]XP_050692610.1 uncharacterized protein LOC126983673 [Eriocheir sinensis]XP_0
MADTLSSNFCSLCGFALDRFSSEKQKKRTSLASPIVEESGLLERLNISVTPLRKDLLFICYSCCTVFTNYTEAKTNFQCREEEAMKLLTEPVAESGRLQGGGQLPFVPYLKRQCMTQQPPPSPSPPAKVPRLEEPLPSAKEEAVKQEVNGKNNIVESAEKGGGGGGAQNNKSAAVAEVLGKGCSSSSLSQLWGSSREFRDSCLSFLSLLIMKETSDILQQDTVFTRPMNGAALHEVSWGPSMEALSSCAPATLCFLLALLGVDASNASKETVEAQHSVVGCLLSMALYKRFRRRASFLPALHTLYLHTARAPPKVRGALQHVGLTIPSFRLAAILKNLEAPHSDLMHSWKKELERTLQVVQRRPKADECPRKLPADRRKLRSILPKPTQVSSYGLSWGCVQSPAPSSSSSPRPSLSQAYGVRSRVPYMMTYRDEPVRAADNIPFEEFVPDSEDFIRVRDQMKKEVQKILTCHVKLFSGLTVNEEHQHSALVSQKSHMVDIGTVFKTPADNGSVASLMKVLKSYLAYDDNEPLPLCIFGEKESVERMVRAKDAMSCFSEKLDRFDGLEPCIADHGRQTLLAKDIISIFFPDGLLAKSSFLRHLNLDKSLFDGCQASDFTAQHTLLQVIAHSYTVALGEMKFLSMEDDLMMSEEDKFDVLERLSEEIVASVWPQVYSESLDTVRQGNKVVKDRECSFGDCINFREKARLPCSESCARPFYFCCQKPLNDGLVECARRDNCPRGAWFHINKKCSGLVEAPEDDWLCEKCSSQRKPEGSSSRTDGLWEYHRGLLWYCLFFLVGQAAERQGNGWLLHAVWKVSMPIFETQGHQDFLQLGYSFLSGVAGRIPRLAAHDSVHNRTVSLTGGLNHNLSWDYAVKVIAKQTKGKMLQKINNKEPGSPRRAEACRLLSVTSAFESQLYPGKLRSPTADDPTLRSVRRNAEQLEALGVLHKVPGRQRVDDVTYSHVIRFRKPGVMVATLRELCTQDVARQTTEQESEGSE